MTTRKFSSLELPHPSYSLDVGRLNLTHLLQFPNDDLNLPDTCVPRISESMHVIEVKERGQSLPRQMDSEMRKILGSYLVINQARPELFLRRDFIKKFIATGKIHLSHRAPRSRNKSAYQLSTKDNVMTITMDPKQYRRFGLVAKKVKHCKGSTEQKNYKIEVDLKNPRILNDNKFQDKMMNILRRLDPIHELCFRFVHNQTEESISNQTANEAALKFFKFVINEYANDGCKPVPLSGCRLVTQKVKKSWLNLSQLHPPLNLKSTIEADDEDLDHLTTIVDWLGYQLLSLDCDRAEIQSSILMGTPATNSSDRVDVSCAHISGAIDIQQTQENISKVFNISKSDGVIFRAMILYPMEDLFNTEYVDHSCVVLLQDISNGAKLANRIAIVGMSELRN